MRLQRFFTAFLGFLLAFISPIIAYSQSSDCKAINHALSSSHTSQRTKQLQRRALQIGCHSAPSNDEQIMFWYQTYLQRLPSDLELKTDRDLLTVYHQTAPEVEAGILGSAEYFKKFSSAQEYVIHLYTMILTRQPSPRELSQGLDVVANRMRTKLALELLKNK